MNYEQLLEQLKRDLPHGYADPTSIVGWAVIAAIAILAVVAVWWILSALGQVYGVWAAHKDGQADLARANNEQQIQVSQAQGRLNAAELNKKAAIVEAEAVAAQIEKIGANLREHDLYLKWQWIQMMEKKPENSTIYVPTECGLPILEAGKRGSRVAAVKDDPEDGDAQE